jgi:hypothetical protein
MKTATHEAGMLQYRKNPQSHAVFFDSADVWRSHRGAAGALARAEA